MYPSEKIKALIEWETKPYRIAKVTGVPENTVRRIWSGEAELKAIKLENAEKLASYYDNIERSLSEAIATVDLLIYKLDKDRQRLTGNYNLHQKVDRNPYKVFEHLHRIAYEPQYADKIQSHQHYLDEIMRCLDNIDIDIAYNIKLSPMQTYYMSCQRHKLEQQEADTA